MTERCLAPHQLSHKLSMGERRLAYLQEAFREFSAEYATVPLITFRAQHRERGLQHFRATERIAHPDRADTLVADSDRVARRHGVLLAFDDYARDQLVNRLPVVCIEKNEHIPDESKDRRCPVIELLSFFDGLPRHLGRLVWVAQHPQAARLDVQNTHTGNVSERLRIKL